MIWLAATQTLILDVKDFKVSVVVMRCACFVAECKVISVELFLQHSADSVKQLGKTYFLFILTWMLPHSKLCQVKFGLWSKVIVVSLSCVEAGFYRSNSLQKYCMDRFCNGGGYIVHYITFDFSHRKPQTSSGFQGPFHLLYKMVFDQRFER